jgi:hypothetical protein
MTRLLVQLLLLLLISAATLSLAYRIYDSAAQVATDTPAHVHAWKPNTSSARDTVRLELLPLPAFAQTVTRPLFFETRRLPTVAVAVPKTAPVQPKRTAAPASQFRVLGIVQHGDTKRALIEGPSVLLDWYSEGDKLQLWTLTRIESTSVLLSFEDQRGELRLFPSGEQN